MEEALAPQTGQPGRTLLKRINSGLANINEDDDDDDEQLTAYMVRIITKLDGQRTPSVL